MTRNKASLKEKIDKEERNISPIKILIKNWNDGA